MQKADQLRAEGVRGRINRKDGAFGAEAQGRCNGRLGHFGSWGVPRVILPGQPRATRRAPPLRWIVRAEWRKLRDNLY